MRTNFADAGTGVRQPIEKSLRGQNLVRLAKRRSRYAKFLAELPLWNPRARCKIALNEVFAQQRPNFTVQ